jgi:Fe-S cluster assembly protein SufB
LNTAVWSGGSFIYVPKGVHIEMPLQAYFRINTQNMGQFERTLIIVDEGAYVHYVEGCTAPTYSSDSLHSAVVEILIKEGGRCRYTTIQNWSNNVYNLVTKRAVAEKNATMEWVDGNLGSRLTMKYPAVILNGEGAHGEVLSIAFAGKGQHQDAGAKITHNAPNTTSQIISKSISKDGGRASYRGLLKVAEGADNVKSNVVCDALLLDDFSRSDTYPTIEIDAKRVTMGHEASVSKIGEDQLFYLMSRGLSEDEANAMIVNGFLEPLVKELPMEYALELNRLIQIQLEGSIG